MESFKIEETIKIFFIHEYFNVWEVYPWAPPLRGLTKCRDGVHSASEMNTRVTLWRPWLHLPSSDSKCERVKSSVLTQHGCQLSSGSDNANA